MTRPRTVATLFPYTTLFRSEMGKPTGFLEFPRHDRGYLKPQERLRNWNEFLKPLPDNELRVQAARCMDCGIPFCHNGCPVNNQRSEEHTSELQSREKLVCRL